MSIKHITLYASLLWLISCSHPSLPANAGVKPPSHYVWNELLHKYVTPDGKVNYKGFIQDSVKLNLYLDSLSQHPPDAGSWSKEEQLAYWINAYNAFTVKIIISHYPLKSITDIRPRLYIPVVNTVWHIKFFKIGGTDFNLDRIEHGILRKIFSEPRIHFAIVCASYSCPPLRNEAFTAGKLDKQLDDQARRFINDPKRNTISVDKIQVSQIFNWFSGDFTKGKTLIHYLNTYSTIQINDKATIKYMEYNWALNE